MLEKTSNPHSVLSLWPLPGTIEKQRRWVMLALPPQALWMAWLSELSIFPWRRIPFCVRSSYRINPQKPLLGFTRLFSGRYFRRSQRPLMKQETSVEMKSPQGRRMSHSVTSLTSGPMTTCAPGLPLRHGYSREMRAQLPLLKGNEPLDIL